MPVAALYAIPLSALHSQKEVARREVQDPPHRLFASPNSNRPVGPALLMPNQESISTGLCIRVPHADLLEYCRMCSHCGRAASSLIWTCNGWTNLARKWGLPLYSRLQRPLISSLVAGLEVGVTASSCSTAFKMSCCCCADALLPRRVLAVDRTSLSYKGIHAFRVYRHEVQGNLQGFNASLSRWPGPITKATIIAEESAQQSRQPLAELTRACSTRLCCWV